MSSPIYGYDGVAITQGDRVELHPATDLWMRGARFGTATLVSVRAGLISVAVDAIARTIRTTGANLRRVDR